jgi:hypothetical protein
MRQRTSQRLTDRATIKRDSQTGENELGEPITETMTVAEGVPCALTPRSTSFVREDSGERVQRPAELRVPASVDVEEGDTVTVVGGPSTFEVRGVRRVADHRRGTDVYQRVEVERA